jgi:hypothetical protein
MSVPHHDDGAAGPPRFSMRRMMLVVTLVCLMMGSGAWLFFGPAIALMGALVLLQLPLLLLVRKRLS